MVCVVGGEVGGVVVGVADWVCMGGDAAPTPDPL